MIDFAEAIGSCCPRCGREGCYRKIQPYGRQVVQLLPYWSGEVQIARFQCRALLVTFSLLPVQLLPYHRYTAATLVFALLLAQDLGCDGGPRLSTVAERELCGDGRVTGHLLGRWLGVVLGGLHAAHHVLAGQYHLAGIVPGRDLRGRLDEVLAYFSAFAPRGPPGRPGSVQEVLGRYGRASGQFLFGTPFQERAGRRAS